MTHLLLFLLRGTGTAAVQAPSCIYIQTAMKTWCRVVVQHQSVHGPAPTSSKRVEKKEDEEMNVWHISQTCFAVSRLAKGPQKLL
ncbi:hypothetical protein B0T11DRAFT_99718 [Plectosphaerella cucumerina]|uniref:Secreted protein n=1 Tax=Plectosphaerella cucumerina TaxID=40658 RepID=A0A8K0TCJ0_9PEZI|nr:hypothetical protein B0T11DRAFT_99718 [Plectosphaerella cucumerina]